MSVSLHTLHFHICYSTFMYVVPSGETDKDLELSEPWNQVFHIRTVHRRIKEEPILHPSVRGEHSTCVLTQYIQVETNVYFTL